MCDSSVEIIFEVQKSSSFGIFQSILTEKDLRMNRLHKKDIFTFLRFLNEYNLSLLLIPNREITDGEPGNNSKFWPILSLAILIKMILIKKTVYVTRRHFVGGQIFFFEPFHSLRYNSFQVLSQLNQF